MTGKLTKSLWCKEVQVWLSNAIVNRSDRPPTAIGYAITEVPNRNFGLNILFSATSVSPHLEIQVVFELLDSQKERALNCIHGALGMPGICTRLWKEQKGQDLLEYALLLLFIVFALVASTKSLSQALQNALGTITNSVSAATTGGSSGGNGTGGAP